MNEPERYSGQRRFPRVHGPFDGWRVGETRTRVQITNLNLGGCVVHGAPEPGDPDTYTLLIQLGVEGEIEVIAAALYHVPDGTAVAFLHPSKPTLELIRQAVDRRTGE